jgi:excisionase family DNA binding protein
VRPLGWLLIIIAPFMFWAVGIGAGDVSLRGFIVAEFVFAGGPLFMGILLVAASRPSRAEMGPEVPFLSPREVAARLNLSEKTIWEAIRSGELPATPRDGYPRIRESDLESWVLRHQTTPDDLLPRGVD